MAKNIRIDAPDEPREDREQRTPSPEDIARRAYDLYQARGAEQGRDMDDWLRRAGTARAAGRAGAVRPDERGGVSLSSKHPAAHLIGAVRIADTCSVAR